MKKFLIGLAVLAALPLGACAGLTAPVSPATYANTTPADEFTATTAELAYKSWRIAATTLVQTGLIKATTAGNVAAIDNKLYAALVLVEKAYESANAADIKTAVNNFNSQLATAYGAIGGK